MKLQWEDISSNTSRARVFGGWIVNVYSKKGETLVFIPDIDHVWGSGIEESYEGGGGKARITTKLHINV